MRSDEQINNEVARLTVVLKQHNLSPQARMKIRIQMDALTARVTPSECRVRWFGYDAMAAEAAAYWMEGAPGVNRPSHNL